MAILLASERVNTEIAPKQKPALGVNYPKRIALSDARSPERLEMPDLPSSRSVLAVWREFIGGKSAVDHTFLCPTEDHIKDVYKAHSNPAWPDLVFFSGTLNNRIREAAFADLAPLLVATKDRVRGYEPILEIGLLSDNSTETKTRMYEVFRERHPIWTAYNWKIMRASDFGVMLESPSNPDKKIPVPEDAWVYAEG